MCADGAALSHLIEGSPVGGRAIVAEVGNGERRRVLEAAVGAEPGAGRERVIGAVDRRGEWDRRQLLISTQRLQRRLIADAEVDTEVDISRVDFAAPEAEVEAR